MIRRIACLLALLLALVACGSAGGAARQEPQPATPDTASAAPTAMTIPAIDAESTLVPTGINPDGTVEVPPDDDPMQASWLDRWPAPGDSPGPAVILGHVDGEVDGQAGQPGIFHRLHELQEGDRVTVARDRAPPAAFTVTAVERVSKAEFPAPRVYDATGAPELRLITCGGVFDQGAGSYTDNVIVYAEQE